MWELLALLVPMPTSHSRSSTVTSQVSEASLRAMAHPTTPAPMITTEGPLSLGVVICYSSSLFSRICLRSQTNTLWGNDLA